MRNISLNRWRRDLVASPSGTVVLMVLVAMVVVFKVSVVDDVDDDPWVMLVFIMLCVRFNRRDSDISYW